MLLLRQAMAAMERKFSFTWQLVGAFRTPTLSKCAADSLLNARMRRGGTARGALPRRPTLQMLKKLETAEAETEEVETEEDEAESGFGPLLGELLKID